MTTEKKPTLYDVYVSYPPGIDPERINSCIRENLEEKEAEDLIHSLSNQKQVIVAEWCTRKEWENAQHYFNYMGLDVITRQSLALADEAVNETSTTTQSIYTQCPVCFTNLDDETATECPTCSFNLSIKATDKIQLKRIEWQERIAFESRKQKEIAHRLQQEKELEESRLRKQIRAELEQEMKDELYYQHQIKHEKKRQVCIWRILFVLIICGLIGIALWLFA